MSRFLTSWAVEQTPKEGAETSSPTRRELGGRGLLAGLPEDRSLHWTPSLKALWIPASRAVVSPGHNRTDHVAGKAVSKHAFHHP